MAIAGVEPHASGVAPRHDAEAVVLDLVQPNRGARNQLPIALRVPLNHSYALPDPEPPGWLLRNRDLERGAGQGERAADRERPVSAARGSDAYHRHRCVS